MTVRPDRRLVRKAVGYVVRKGRLLVFSRDDIPLEVVGVQVPAGTIEDGELPEVAAVREVLEETNLHARVVRALGVERYDVWPSKPEIHERHFFQLATVGEDLEEQWSAGEPGPSGDGPPQRWTCRWIPLEQAHVLCAGFGARLGHIAPTSTGA
ncbi:NUDIX domain-containing protein [Tessaracoccus bendigoensis DSM 12906]|uniref:NUDIX domain-containing protein n=1 Tax=Tessaracoccus bendigoensis DSM 12906 TaxID=1123357 RepID=A0A1M6KFI1_9ACTN|nr:NUDIX domain-containing protein [Tessaracoccus bendigoensis]SHJ57706.1 NUDIX domain-containing protein [Tessaracoccus bendigoensis DSM 12906]